MSQAANNFKAQMIQQERVNKTYEDLSNQYGYEPKLVVQRNMFGVPSEGKNRDPKILNYAKQHGLDYEKAQRILKARGYGD
jgi:hypothetical protein